MAVDERIDRFVQLLGSEREGMKGRVREVVDDDELDVGMSQDVD
jgi:hypothetical protein